MPSLRPFSQTKYTQSSMSVLIEEDKTLKEFLMVLLGLFIQNRIGCFFQNRVSATGKLDSASTILSPAKSLNFRIPTIAKSILRATKQASQRFQFLRRVWSSVFILSAEEGIVSVCVNCKPGDKKWSERGIAGDFDSVEDVKYMDGVLYCCLNPRVIGAFTVASNDWKLLPHPYSERASRTHYESFSCGVRW